jgi:acetyl esterase/lipase
MCSLLKSWNPLVNVALFPGAYVRSTYTAQSVAQCEEGQGLEGARVLFIPVRPDPVASLCFAVPAVVPAVLVPNPDRCAQIVVIYFHGNGCDAGNVTPCGFYEAKEFNAHYLIVEYPRYGLGVGLPSESCVNNVAKAVFSFVEGSLGVDHSQIVISGRSIGTGPACFLASYMEKLNKKPAALILHSPYTSIRNAGAELVGPISNGILNRWENWKNLSDNTDGVQVVSSPVLFLHADNDVIIDCSHSQLLHQARLDGGYTSALFIQRSNPKLIKGHNYFDYDKDYLYPVRMFLKRVLPPNLASITLPDNVLSAMSIMPENFKPGSTIKYMNSAVLGLSWLLCPVTLCLECVAGCSATALLHGELYLNGAETVNKFDYDPNPSAGRPKGFTDNYFVKALFAIFTTGSVEFNFENEESLKQKSSENLTAKKAVVMSANKAASSPRILYKSVDGTENPLHQTTLSNEFGLEMSAPAENDNETVTSSSKHSYPNEIIIEEMAVRPRRRRRMLDGGGVALGGDKTIAKVVGGGEAINPMVALEMESAGVTDSSIVSDSESEDSDDDSIYHSRSNDTADDMGSNGDGSRVSSPHKAKKQISRRKLDYVPG